MSKWTNRIGRAVMMGLAWALGWLPVGVLAGLFAVGELEPEWIGGPLYAGFLCGAVFSVVCEIAGDRDGLNQITAFRSGALGALSGLLSGGLWLVVVLLSDPPRWLFEGAVVGALTILSAASGVGTALLARLAKPDDRRRVA